MVYIIGGGFGQWGLVFLLGGGAAENGWPQRGEGGVGLGMEDRRVRGTASRRNCRSGESEWLCQLEVVADRSVHAPLGERVRLSRSHHGVSE